jgi:uridine kinase
LWFESLVIEDVLVTVYSLAVIDRIATDIQRLLQRRSFVLVAIDGRGGAGKSTLAAELSPRFGATVVAIDDFSRAMDEAVRWRLSAEEAYRQNFDWQRLRDQVLVPLRRNQPASYQRYDWILKRLGETAQAEPKGVVVIEGVGSCRPELRPFYDYSIFVDTPPEVCVARLKARGHNNEEWIPRWCAAEDWYIQHFDPRAFADIVVS